jgi:hypothetical protein
MVGGNQGGGFGEGVQRSFALDDASAFRQLMLDIYGSRCAVTDGALGPGDDDSLEVFLFQPLEHGGAMSPSNAVVVDRAAAGLLRRGIVLVDDDYVTFLPHPEYLEAGVDAKPLPGRRLALPDNVSLWPERTMLAYHRSLFRAQ